VTELIELSLDQMIRRLRNGEISSRELTLAFLRRIEQLEPRLHAFITLTPELALAQADRADQQLTSWREQALKRGIAGTIGHPNGSQRCAVRSWHTMHLWIANPGEFHPGIQCDHCRAIAGSRAVGVGEVEYRRVAMGHQPRTRLWRYPQPVEPAHVPGGSSGGSAAAWRRG